MESHIDTKLQMFRIVAYSSVVFSVIGAVSLCVTLPMMLSYVQNTKLQISKESAHCKVSLHFF